LPGKTKEKTKSGFRTKKEAQVEAAELEKKLYLKQHTIIENQETILKDWLNEWLDVYGSQFGEGTLTIRKLYINKHIIPSLGNYKINQLSRIEYQKFINALIKQEYAKSTIQSIHSIFSAIINKAVELEMIPDNKYRGISIKAKKDNEKTIIYLEKKSVLLWKLLNSPLSIII